MASEPSNCLETESAGKADNSSPIVIADLVVGALGLDVSGLLALVADLLAAGRLLRAIAGEVAVLAAVVALGAIGAVAFVVC